jgi:hypothetical protein
VIRRLTDPCWRGVSRAPSVGRDLAWYLDRLHACGSRFEAEGWLANALEDTTLSDDHFHSVRLYFDHLASKGWLS